MAAPIISWRLADNSTPSLADFGKMCADLI